jgi:hypothetical protein
VHCAHHATCGAPTSVTMKMCSPHTATVQSPNNCQSTPHVGMRSVLTPLTVLSTAASTSENFKTVTVQQHYNLPCFSCCQLCLSIRCALRKVHTVQLIEVSFHDLEWTKRFSTVASPARFYPSAAATTKMNKSAVLHAMWSCITAQEKLQTTISTILWRMCQLAGTLSCLLTPVDGNVACPQQAKHGTKASTKKSCCKIDALLLR